MSKLTFKKPHLKSLTGLRFLAIISIVLFHHGGALCILGSTICTSIGYGYVSVSLFFTLSGFLLAYVYLDPKNLQPVEAKKFWIARFARIYPLYLLSLVASFPSFASKFDYFSGSFTTTLKGILSAFLSLLLLQSWTPWTSTIFNTPTWAVSNEAFFYFIFPFIAIPIARLSMRKLIYLAAICWVFALLPPIYLSDLFRAKNETFSALWLPFFAYSPWFHLPQFSIGVCTGVLFLNQEKWNFKHKFYPIACSTLFGILCLSVFRIFATNPESHYVFLSNGLLAPFFCIVILYLARSKGLFSNFIASPQVLILGESSYAIYLFQNPLLSLMKRLPIHLLGVNSGSIPLFDLIFLGLYIFVLIILSVFATYAIENPLRRTIVSRFNK